MKKTRLMVWILAVALCMASLTMPALADDVSISYTVSPGELAAAGEVTLEMKITCPINNADRLDNVKVTRAGQTVIDIGEVTPGNTRTATGTLKLAEGDLNKDIELVVAWSEGGAAQSKKFTVKVAKDSSVPSVDFSATAGRYTGNVGDLLEFTYTVKNTGTVELTNLKLNDFGREIGTKTSLKAGASHSFTYKHELTADTNSEPKLTYTAAGKTGTVTAAKKAVTVNKPEAQITITADKTEVTPGDKVTLLYTIKNTGTEDMGALAVTDKASGETLYEAESLKVGTTRTFQRQVTVTADTDFACTLTTKDAQNKEYKTDSSALKISANSPQPSYQLSITAKANQRQLEVPGEVVFTIELTNYGNQDINNILVLDKDKNVVKALDGALKTGSRSIDHSVTVSQSADYLFYVRVNAGMAGSEWTSDPSNTVSISVNAPDEEEEQDDIEDSSARGMRLSTALIIIAVVTILLVAALAVLIILMAREKNKARSSKGKSRRPQSGNKTNRNRR